MTEKTDNAPHTASFSELILQAQAGDKAAEEALVQSNLPLVHAIIRRFAARGVETDDLRQLGMLGLLKAIRRFDASYGVRFSTYAVPYIAGEIKQFLRDDGMVKYSRQVKELASRIAGVTRERGECSLDILAAELGCTPEDAAVAIGSMSGTSSLDAVSEDGGAPLGERQAAPDEYGALFLRLYISELTSGLTKREALILQLRYACDLTQKETAARLHVSQVQISRLEKKILEAIRRTHAPD